MSYQLKQTRQGVTLMEVLISIFVVSVGLLGVAALIPLAGHQTEQGSRNDRKANVGRRSFREFLVRGFNEPGEFADRGWISNTMNGISAVNGQPDPNFSDGVLFDQVEGDFIPAQAFCIDPLYMAVDSDNDGTPERVPATAGQAERFPFIGAPVEAYNASGTLIEIAGPAPSVGMPYLGADSGDRPMQMPRVTLASGTVPMIRAHAEELFIFRDDLTFELPDGNDELATQNMIRSDVTGDGIPDDLKRDAAENYSWFATLFPRGDQWLLSTVIVRDRNFSADTAAPFAPSFEITGAILGEQLVAGDPLQQSGYYSIEGDVRVDWGAAGTAGALGDDGVRVGAWILIGFDYALTPPPPAVPAGENFHWYRVTSAAELEFAGGRVLQDLVLSGPTLPEDVNMIVGYIVGTEAVYQKTIKLKY